MAGHKGSAEEPGESTTFIYPRMTHVFSRGLSWLDGQKPEGQKPGGRSWREGNKNPKTQLNQHRGRKGPAGDSQRKEDKCRKGIR